MCDGDRAGLFGDHDGNRVRGFADAERGAMAQPKLLLRERGINGKGKHTGGAGDAILAKNDRAIVQRRILDKNLHQQFSADQRIHFHARVHIILQTGFALNDDQRPIMLIRKLLAGEGNALDLW